MSISYRPPFIVVGTGRCGTVSAAEILNRQRNTVCTHEQYLLRWYEYGDRMVGQMIEGIKDCQKKGITRGHVGYMYLPHIGEIRSACRDLKVVRLRRDKESTVDSFCRFGSFMLRPKDKQKWADTRSGRPREYVNTFPVIDGVSPRQAFEFYWEYYTKMMSILPDPVMDLDMDELNDRDKIDELMDWLEIPESDREIPEQTKWHSWKDTRGFADEKQAEVYGAIVYDQWK